MEDLIQPDFYRLNQTGWTPQDVMTLWEFSCYSKEYNPRKMKPVCAHDAPNPNVIQGYDEIVDSYSDQEEDYEDMELTPFPAAAFLNLGDDKREILFRYNHLILAVQGDLLHPLQLEGRRTLMRFRFSELKQYAIAHGWEMPDSICRSILIPDVRQVLYSASRLQMLIDVFVHFLSGVTDTDTFPDRREMKEYIKENWDRVSQGRVRYTESIGNDIVRILNSDSVSHGGAPRKPL